MSAKCKTVQKMKLLCSHWNVLIIQEHVILTMLFYILWHNKKVSGSQLSQTDGSPRLGSINDNILLHLSICLFSGLFFTWVSSLCTVEFQDLIFSHFSLGSHHPFVLFSSHLLPSTSDKSFFYYLISLSPLFLLSLPSLFFPPPTHFVLLKVLSVFISLPSYCGTPKALSRPRFCALFPTTVLCLSDTDSFPLLHLTCVCVR